MRCKAIIERNIEKNGKKYKITYRCPSKSFVKRNKDGKVVYICKRCGAIQ